MKKYLIFLGCWLLFAVALCKWQEGRDLEPIQTRTVFHSGKIIQTHDYKKSHPGIFWIFTRRGVFYFDTSVGEIFRLDNWDRICPEDQKLVDRNLKELMQMDELQKK